MRYHDTVYVQVMDLDNLKAVFSHAGTQATISRRSGVGPARVSQIVLGKVKAVPIEDAAALEDACEVPHGTLFAHPRPDLAPAYCQAA